MGQEELETHTFACRGCKEPITIRLEVDYRNIRHRVVCISNCTSHEELQDASIVNLDANFLIPIAEQGIDVIMPRMAQMHAMIGNKFGTTRKITVADQNSRPRRRPDFSEEWRLLGSGLITSS